MFSTHAKNSLPSIKLGIFHYQQPFSDLINSNEIKEIASRYSIPLGNCKVVGINYLFINNFITLKEADMLASQLVNWRGISINWSRMSAMQESTFFTPDHMDALIALVQDKEVRRISLDQTVCNLQHLTSAQARRIANGLTREEAMSNLPFDDIDQSSVYKYSSLNKF